MQHLTLNGETIYVVEGFSLQSPEVVVTYGLHKRDLESYIARGQLAQFAQFAKLISDGLILSTHCFQGLRRALHCDDQDNGDESKFAMVRKPARDYTWTGGSSGHPVEHIAPTRCVFVTLISRNDRHKSHFPNIEGWIERWSWVDEEEDGLLEAPTKWVDRYERKVWTR